jgi:hypothetical protein
MSRLRNVAVDQPQSTSSTPAAGTSTQNVRRQLGLVRGGWLRIRQLPVARHVEILRAGCLGRVRRGPQARVREPVRRRLPLDTGHVPPNVFHSGYVPKTMTINI